MADPLAYTPIVTPRGFTGHEHLDAVGLVHMNGRVYDAELGRFLSADPVVQDRTNLQALNRYTYVLNNPLSLTDPTGFFFGSLFKAISGLFNAVFEGVQLVLKTVLGPILEIPILGTILQGVGTFFACAPPTGNPALCAGAAAAFTAARGGTLLDAFKSAALAYAGAELFASLKDAHDLIQIGAGGLFGGTTSELSGGSFVEGFVAGGATAKVLGGKFENGAITGAFVAIFVEWQSGSFDGPSNSHDSEATVSAILSVDGEIVQVGWWDHKFAFKTIACALSADNCTPAAATLILTTLVELSAHIT